MKKIISIILAIMMIATLTGCSQCATRNYGGDMTVNLDYNVKLVDVTWKENNLWFLTKPMTEDDVAETYYFEEDSEFGIFEGTVTIIEHKK